MDTVTPRYLFALRWRLWSRWVLARQRWRYGSIPRWQIDKLLYYIGIEHSQEDGDE